MRVGSPCWLSATLALSMSHNWPITDINRHRDSSALAGLANLRDGGEAPSRRPPRGLPCCAAGASLASPMAVPAPVAPTTQPGRAGPGRRDGTGPPRGGEGPRPPFVSGSSGRPRTPVDAHQPRSTSTQLTAGVTAIAAGPPRPRIRSGSTCDPRSPHSLAALDRRFAQAQS